jgi:hypothetical protein
MGVGRLEFAIAQLALMAVVGGCVGCTTDSDSTSHDATSSQARPETDLHRPLDLPRLDPDEPCPRTAGGRPNPDVGIALGPGPAYPVLGLEKAPQSPRGVVQLYDDERRDGRYWHKTLWAVDPDYDGPVLIRGRGLYPPRDLLFGVDSQRLDELEFPAEETGSWRYGPSVTILPGPGCYAYQLDGTGFSRVIVFEAVHRLKGKA